jgi:phosphoglycolate phosphatase-like HAD superfamily hydrolase
MMLNAAVFDLDGTVFNVKKRLDRCLSEGDGGECADPNRAFRIPRDRCSRFWECYLSPKYMHLDEPYDTVVSRIRELYESGIHIFLISGRLEKKQMETTIDQLRRYQIP